MGDANVEVVPRIVMRATREFPMGLALVVLEGNEEEAHIPEQVKPLVQFSDVVIDSLLAGLPHSEMFIVPYILSQVKCYRTYLLTG